LKIPYILDTMVIEITKDKKIYAINNKEGLIEVSAKAVILAMGCREKTRGAINIPGFRPAGIYTAGQAQRFVNIEGYLPGHTFVILGSGDIGMIMARRLTWEGCEVKAVVEIQPYVSGLLRNQVQCLEDYDIPLITSYTVSKIHGSDRVKGVTITKVSKDYDRIIGSEKFIECDTLLLSVGLIPENELTLQAGATLSQNGGPLVDNNLETTIEGIKNVIDYIQNRYDKSIKKEDKIKFIPGENINYIKPDHVNKSDIESNIVFNFRVKYPDRRVIIQFKDENNKVIYKRKKVYVIPSEMIELNLNLKEIGVEMTIKKIRIEVIPRPEVLIEED